MRVYQFRHIRAGRDILAGYRFCGSRTSRSRDAPRSPSLLAAASLARAGRAGAHSAARYGAGWARRPRSSSRSPLPPLARAGRRRGAARDRSASSAALRAAARATPFPARRCAGATGSSPTGSPSCSRRKAVPLLSASRASATSTTLRRTARASTGACRRSARRRSGAPASRTAGAGMKIGIIDDGRRPDAIRSSTRPATRCRRVPEGPDARSRRRR